MVTRRFHQENHTFPAARKEKRGGQSRFGSGQPDQQPLLLTEMICWKTDQSAGAPSFLYRLHQGKARIQETQTASLRMFGGIGELIQVPPL